MQRGTGSFIMDGNVIFTVAITILLSVCLTNTITTVILNNKWQKNTVAHGCAEYVYDVERGTIWQWIEGK